MANWSLIGFERHEKFEESLEADVLANELNYYRVELGETFGLRDLLEIKRIEALALIAEMIGDAPEYLVHQLCIAQTDGCLNGIAHSLDGIANALE